MLKNQGFHLFALRGAEPTALGTVPYEIQFGSIYQENSEDTAY